MVLVTEPKRRVPLHHKKRVGEHHKQGKHYNKTYWPYLPLALMVVGGLLLSGAWSRQGKVLGYAVDVSPASLLQETNYARAQNSEPALSMSTALTQAAQSKAADMAEHNYWSHTSPSGEQPWQFIAAAGYGYAAAGENLAYGFGDSDSVVNAWMHSAEHRANVLSADYQSVGFGIANAPNFQGKGPETIVVAMYAEPATDAATSNASGKVLGAQDSQSVSRLQLFGISADPWLFGLVTALAGAAAGIFIVRHALLWRRALVRSEVFVARHRLLDIALVALAIAGFMLTRAAGTIG